MAKRPVTLDPTVPPDASGYRWDSANGEWVDPAHANAAWVPPAGVTPAPGPYASIPAQTAAANNTNTLDQASLYRAQAAAAGVNAAAATTSANAQVQQNTNTATRNQQMHEEALANQGLTQQQISNAYNSDKAKFGIDKANLLLNARQAAAKSMIDSANFQLNQNQVNAQSRQVMAGQQLDALKMLAARQGPQDFSRWDYISAGEHAPTPTSSQTYSPLDMIAAQYQPSNVAAPAGFDASGIDVGGFPDAATSITPSVTPGPSPAGASGGGSSPVTMPQPQAQPVPAGGIPTEGDAPIYPRTPDPHAQGTTTLSPTPPVSNGGPRYALAGGGVTPGAAIVGDSKSGKPTQHEEVAYASNNPRTGVAELHVIPHELIAKLLDHHGGRSDGMVMKSTKVPKEMAHMLPRAAEGGDFGPVEGDQFMTQGASAGGSPPSVSIGAVPQYKPSAGATIQPMPQTTPQYQPQQPSGPQRAPGTMVYSTTPSIQPSPGPAAGPQTPAAPSYSGSQANLVGGMNVGGTAAPPPQSLGPAGYDPYRITQNHYSNADMNNSPVLRMIRGQMPVTSFGGYGDYRPGVQSQGITDLPLGLNYADLMHMDPNRLKMLSGVYDNPETGVSWDSIMNMSKMAAPRTGNLGVARAR